MVSGSVEAINIAQPAEPEYRGALMVRYVYGAANEEEFAARVHEWASSWIRRAMQPKRAGT